MARNREIAKAVHAANMNMSDTQKKAACAKKAKEPKPKPTRLERKIRRNPGMKQGAPNDDASFLNLFSLKPGNPASAISVTGDDTTAELTNKELAGPSTSTPRNKSPGTTGRNSPSLGPSRLDTLLDYEPNIGSPATPVDDSILDHSTDDAGAEEDEKKNETPADTPEDGVYFEPSMVEAVITEEDGGNIEQASNNTNEGRGEPAKKSKGSG